MSIAYETKAVCDATEYRTLDRFPGYRFGSDGSVWSCWQRFAVEKGYPVLKRKGEAWKKLKYGVNSRGRAHVTLCLNGGKERVVVAVHRAILEAFIGPAGDGLEACHNDGDPLNNNLNNLRWDTRSANQLDRRSHGTSLSGRSHPRPTRKYTEESIKQVKKLHSERVPQVQIARSLGMPKTTVNAIVKGRAWAWLQ